MYLMAHKIFQSSCKLKNIQAANSAPGYNLLFEYGKSYYNSGILIWHILEDRIFMSEGFCRLLGINKAGVSNLEYLFHSDPECEFRNYLRNILNQVCNDEIEDSNFKTRIPGINKEIFGSVQLFDRDDLGISDLVLICWKS